MEDLCCAHNKRKPNERCANWSALSMKRVAWCPESQLYVVTLIGEVDEGGVGMPISPTLANVLDEVCNWMPKSLPKVLPPRCFIDHCIELELGCNL
jgi:hypothetical protein